MYLVKKRIPNLLAALVISSCMFILETNAHAIPAFARREKVSCTMCHTNGSAPHLTKFGYMYRRAAFRLPDNIGNREADDKAMLTTDHLSAGVNFDYEVVTNKPAGQNRAILTSNHFNVPEVEVWPVVGSFLGNFGSWSEIDANPASTAGAGGVSVSQADVRYVRGTGDFFFNFRGGLMPAEGYGASDQWIDDANIPLFDRLPAQFNENTLTLPFGAMETPQYGAEFGLNRFDSHLTFGIYNGFDGSNTKGATTPAQSTLTAALMNPVVKGAKDYKVQFDQFAGEHFAFTAAYYTGVIPLLDPGNTTLWINHYSNWRLYTTFLALPNLLDILAGVAYGKYDYSNTGNVVNGQFNNRGAFLGANYYVMPHLTLSGRLDFYQYNYGTSAPLKAQGFGLLASVPFDNAMFVFHYNNTGSDVDGLTNDFRAEWRFLF